MAGGVQAPRPVTARTGYDPYGDSPPTDFLGSLDTDVSHARVLLLGSDPWHILASLAAAGARPHLHAVDVAFVDKEPVAVARAGLLLLLASELDPKSDSDMSFLWHVWNNELWPKGAWDRLKPYITRLRDSRVPWMVCGCEGPEVDTALYQYWLDSSTQPMTQEERLKHRRNMVEAELDKEVGSSACPPGTNYTNFCAQRCLQCVSEALGGVGLPQAGAMADILSQSFASWAEYGGLWPEGWSHEHYPEVNTTLYNHTAMAWTSSFHCSPVSRWLPLIERGRPQPPQAVSVSAMYANLSVHKMRRVVAAFQQHTSFTTTTTASGQRQGSKASLRVFLHCTDPLQFCCETVTALGGEGRSGGGAATVFHVIETGSLCDRVGLLPLLVSATPRLAQTRGSRMRTEVRAWGFVTDNIKDYMCKYTLGLPVQLFPTMLGLRLVTDIEHGSQGYFRCSDTQYNERTRPWLLEWAPATAVTGAVTPVCRPVIQLPIADAAAALQQSTPHDGLLAALYSVVRVCCHTDISSHQMHSGQLPAAETVGWLLAQLALRVQVQPLDQPATASPTEIITLLCDAAGPWVADMGIMYHDVRMGAQRASSCLAQVQSVAAAASATPSVAQTGDGGPPTVGLDRVSEGTHSYSVHLTVMGSAGKDNKSGLSFAVTPQQRPTNPFSSASHDVLLSCQQLPQLPALPLAFLWPVGTGTQPVVRPGDSDNSYVLFVTKAKVCDQWPLEEPVTHRLDIGALETVPHVSEHCLWRQVLPDHKKQKWASDMDGVKHTMVKVMASTTAPSRKPGAGHVVYDIYSSAVDKRSGELVYQICVMPTLKQHPDGRVLMEATVRDCRGGINSNQHRSRAQDPVTKLILAPLQVELLTRCLWHNSQHSTPSSEVAALLSAHSPAADAPVFPTYLAPILTEHPSGMCAPDLHAPSGQPATTAASQQHSQHGQSLQAATATDQVVQQYLFGDAPSSLQQTTPAYSTRGCFHRPAAATTSAPPTGRQSPAPAAITPDPVCCLLAVPVPSAVPQPQFELVPVPDVAHFPELPDTFSTVGLTTSQHRNTFLAALLAAGLTPEDCLSHLLSITCVSAPPTGKRLMVAALLSATCAHCSSRLGPHLSPEAGAVCVVKEAQQAAAAGTALVTESEVEAVLGQVCAAGCGRYGAGMLACAGCSQLVYCSRGCQKAHWKSQHSGNCARLRQIQAKAPASPEPRVAVPTSAPSTGYASKDSAPSGSTPPRSTANCNPCAGHDKFDFTFRHTQPAAMPAEAQPSSGLSGPATDMHTNGMRLAGCDSVSCISNGSVTGQSGTPRYTAAAQSPATPTSTSSSSGSVTKTPRYAAAAGTPSTPNSAATTQATTQAFTAGGDRPGMTASLPAQLSSQPTIQECVRLNPCSWTYQHWNQQLQEVLAQHSELAGMATQLTCTGSETAYRYPAILATTDVLMLKGWTHVQAARTAADWHHGTARMPADNPKCIRLVMAATLAAACPALYGMSETARARSLLPVWESDAAAIDLPITYLQSVCCRCGQRLAEGGGRGACGGCHQVVYCGLDCQKADWKQGHKQACKVFKQAADDLAAQAATAEGRAAGLAGLLAARQEWAKEGVARPTSGRVGHVAPAPPPPSQASAAFTARAHSVSTGDSACAAAAGSEDSSGQPASQASQPAAPASHSMPAHSNAGSGKKLPQCLPSAQPTPTRQDAARLWTRIMISPLHNDCVTQLLRSIEKHSRMAASALEEAPISHGGRGCSPVALTTIGVVGEVLELLGWPMDDASCTALAWFKNPDNIPARYPRSGRLLVAGMLAVACPALYGMSETARARSLLPVWESDAAAIDLPITYLHSVCCRCGQQLPEGGGRGACGGCHQVVYCGLDCQKAAWKQGHKQACKVLKQAADDLAAHAATAEGRATGLAGLAAAREEWAREAGQPAVLSHSHSVGQNAGARARQFSAAPAGTTPSAASPGPAAAAASKVAAQQAGPPAEGAAKGLSVTDVMDMMIDRFKDKPGAWFAASAAMCAKFPGSRPAHWHAQREVFNAFCHSTFVSSRDCQRLLEYTDQHGLQGVHWDWVSRFPGDSRLMVVWCVVCSVLMRPTFYVLSADAQVSLLQVAWNYRTQKAQEVEFERMVCGSCGAQYLGGRRAPLPCPGCQCVWYCNDTCQREHWNEQHKPICRHTRRVNEELHALGPAAPHQPSSRSSSRNRDYAPTAQQPTSRAVDIPDLIYLPACLQPMHDVTAELLRLFRPVSRAAEVLAPDPLDSATVSSRGALVKLVLPRLGEFPGAADRMMAVFDYMAGCGTHAQPPKLPGDRQAVRMAVASVLALGHPALYGMSLKAQAAWVRHMWQSECMVFDQVTDFLHDVCANCGEQRPQPDMLRCRLCKQTVYCSAQCKQQQAAQHKQHCPLLVQATAELGQLLSGPQRTRAVAAGLGGLTEARKVWRKAEDRQQSGHYPTVQAALESILDEAAPNTAPATTARSSGSGQKPTARTKFDFTFKSTGSAAKPAEAQSSAGLAGATADATLNGSSGAWSRGTGSMRVTSDRSSSGHSSVSGYTGAALTGDRLLRELPSPDPHQAGFDLLYQAAMLMGGELTALAEEAKRGFEELAAEAEH